MFWGRQRFNRTVSGGVADELIKCAKKGKTLSYSRAETVPALDEVGAFGGHRALDASHLRDVLAGGLHGDPRGVQIRGAYLRGLLDLDSIKSTIGLRFTGCRFDQPPSLRDAVLPWLHLDGCVLPGIVASRARIGTLSITGCRIEGNSQDGAVQLDGVHIQHELDMRRTSITNNCGVALSGAALNVGDGACTGVLLDGLSAAGRAGRAGTVRLSGARISGSLLLCGAWLTNATGPALVADGIRVSGDTRLARSPASGTEFQATGAAGTGTVLLRGAVLAGELTLHGARIKSVASAGPGLARDATGAGPGVQPGSALGATPGALCLSGSTIRRDLVLRDTALVNSTGPALAADRVRVGGSALLDRGLLAHGARQDGAVRLARAEISGDLLLHGARLASGTGPALLADGLSVHGDLMLAAAAVPGPAFCAAGAGEAGTVLLRGVSVGGTLSLDGAVVEHPGPAGAGPVDARFVGAGVAGTGLAAGGPGVSPAGAGAGGGLDGGGPGDQARAVGEQARREMTVGQPARVPEITRMLLGSSPDGRSPDGSPPPGQPPSLGAVCLDGSTVGGRLVFSRALLRSDTGPAVRASRLVVRSGVTGGSPPGPGLTAVGAGADGAVCLASADITGPLALPGATLINASGPALAAAAARIHGDVRLDHDFVAAGVGQAGGVVLAGAEVDQELSCSGWFACQAADGTAGAARGPALDLGRARVGTVRLGGRRPAGFAADGGFRLDGLRYSGLPVLGDPELLTPRPEHHGPRRRRRPGPTGDRGSQRAAVAQWLSWLRHETPEHADQPYAALAAAYRAAGQDGLARTILVAQRDDARARSPVNPARRLGQQAARWLTGYGYRSWYALLWLAGLLAVTVGLAVFWFGPARYIQPTPAGGPAIPVVSPSPTVSASPSASPSPAARPSPSASAFPSASTSPSASGRRPAVSGSLPDGGSRPPGRTPRTGAADDPGPPECGLAGRAGYALDLVLPFTGQPGPCTASSAPGLLVFGWLVRVLAITLLAVYVAGLVGLTQRHPGPG